MKNRSIRRSIWGHPLSLHLITIGLCAILLSVPARAEDWLHWGGPSGDFMAPSEGLANHWPEDGPPLLWKRPLGEGYAAVVSQGDHLYTAYRKGSEEVVIALSAKDGSTLWKSRGTPTLWDDMSAYFGSGPNSTPLILDGSLVTVDVAGRVQGHDLADGKILWKRDFPGELGRRKRVEEYGYSGSPLAYGGKAILLVGGDEHAVVALDPKDGSYAWKSAPGGVSYAQPTLTRLAGRDHYVYFSPEGLVGLDPASGKTLWTLPIEFNNGNHLTPIVPCDETHFWAGSQFGTGGGRLVEIVEGAEGRLEARQVWFFRKLQSSHWPLVRLGDHIYGSLGGNRVSFLSAFDWRTGEVLWKKRGFHKAQALHADGKLLFLDEDGQLVLSRVSPEGLEVLAQAAIARSPAWTVPTLVSTTLYVRDQEHLWAFDLGEPASPENP